MLECRLAVVFGFIFRNKDVITVTMTSKVNGKTGTLTPGRSETPENFITKIGHIDYVAGATRTPNFMGIGLGCPPHK